jgi:hypothetical protein
MFNHMPRPFFADFIEVHLIEAQMFPEQLRLMGLSTSADHEILNFSCKNKAEFDAQVLRYLLDRGFQEVSQVNSEQHCFMTFHKSETFCGCSSIYNPMGNDWWYSVMLSRISKT